MLPCRSDANLITSGPGQQSLAAVTHPLKRFIGEYGMAMLLAVVVHIVILALLLTTFSQPVSPPVAEPIISFLYQPPPAAKQPPVATLPDNPLADEQSMADEMVEQAMVSDDSAGNLPPELNPLTKTTDIVGQNINSADKKMLVNGESLAQRALNQVSKSDYAAIDRAATARYQQSLQKQQQPRLTVDKKHWPLSQEPAKHVLAQLNDGRQIIRTKEGCRMADPMLDGFAGLMAAKPVPCGDETASSELLKQALDKHIKR